VKWSANLANYTKLGNKEKFFISLQAKGYNYNHCNNNGLLRMKQQRTATGFLHTLQSKLGLPFLCFLESHDLYLWPEKGSYSLSELLSLIHQYSSCFQPITFILHPAIVACEEDKWPNIRVIIQATGFQVCAIEKAIRSLFTDQVTYGSTQHRTVKQLAIIRCW